MVDLRARGGASHPLARPPPHCIFTRRRSPRFTDYTYGTDNVAFMPLIGRSRLTRARPSGIPFSTGRRPLMACSPARSTACPCRRLRMRAAVALSSILLLSAVAVTGGPPGLGRPHARPPVLSLKTPHAVVLKSKRVLHLFDGDSLIRSYPIDLGFSPEGGKRRQGDGRTPLGAFRVVTRNPDSPYHRFLGLDYPDRAAVEAGRAEGLISPGEAAAILDSLESGGCPDWSTALGGGIGIHGRRRGFDWTAGCIALSDEHVAELFDVLRIGDRVEILP